MRTLLLSAACSALLFIPLSASSETSGPLRISATSSAPGVYHLELEAAPDWKFNKRASLDERLVLTLHEDDIRFTGHDFTLSDRLASLDFQHSGCPSGELQALLCQKTRCTKVVESLSWPGCDAAAATDDDGALMMLPEIGGNAAASPPTPDPPASSHAPSSPEPPESNPLTLPDVFVSGTRAWQTDDEAPVHAQTIEREAIEQRNARNVAEALEYTSGVRVETGCQNCGFTQLRLNGLGGAYTQILIDGLPSFSGLASVYGLEQIPTEILERVVVVKGGASALYGPGAVAGVVDLVTRQPTENFLGVTTGYDHVGLSAPDARLSFDGAQVSADGRAAAHVFATTRRRTALDLSGDGFSELTALQQLAAGANLFYAPFESGNLRLSFHTLREYRRGGDRLDLPPHAAAIAEELQTERYQGDLRWKHPLSPNLRYALGYVLSYTDRRSYYGGGGREDLELPEDGQPLDEEFREAFEVQRTALGGYGRTLNPLQVGDAHVDLTFDARGPQTLTLGVQGSIDRIDDRFLGYARQIDETYTTLGVYAQHHWIFADWGEAMLGARIDRHSELEAPIASPRAALMLRPASWLRLRTALSTGFRAPQVFDEDLHIDTVGGNARLIVNAPDLQAERSLSITQQVSTALTLPGGADLRVGLNAFHTRLKNAFVLNSIDAPERNEHLLQRTNRGTTSLLGTELEAGIFAPTWALRAGWTLERALNEEPDDDFGTRHILRTPNHYGYLDGLLNLGALRLVSGIEITGPMRVPRYDASGAPARLHTSPWFFNWSANLSFATIARGELLLEPFLGVRNVLDSRQRDFDQGPTRDAGYVYGPSQPRTLYAGIKGRL
ncbi:TonB-dependent receptor plug domain-containing protein [Lujinxingia vulgaris]|nr:TonB-dependent receptor [Lujinxingia vulgaris]